MTIPLMILSIVSIESKLLNQGRSMISIKKKSFVLKFSHNNIEIYHRLLKPIFEEHPENDADCVVKKI